MPCSSSFFHGYKEAQEHKKVVWQAWKFAIATTLCVCAILCGHEKSFDFAMAF